METPHGDSTFQTFMALKTATQPQLPAPWLMFDPLQMIPNKSRNIVKRTLKDKHISKSKLTHMFVQIVEWIRTVSMDVVLPALVLCLREEESMILEAKTRAEEWEKLNINVPYNSNCAHCVGPIASTDRTSNGAHISGVESEEAGIIGMTVFARVMDFLHCKYLLNMSERRFLETLEPSDSLKSLDCCLKQELIHMFNKDLINCVYQELLTNDMGKTFPVDYLCLELLRQMFTEIPARWEFYMDVLKYFCRWAAENHLKLFLKLPRTPHEDRMEENWHSVGPRTMTKAERRTLDILSKTVTDMIMNIVDQATENPLRAAEIVRQGKKSGAQSTEESEFWGSKSPKPDIVPENEVLGPSSGIKVEDLDSEEELELEDVVSKCFEELYELKRLKSETPKPYIIPENELFTPRPGIKKKTFDSEQKMELEDILDEAPFERSSQSGTEEEEITEASQGLTYLPYHLVESVVNGLLAKFEVADIFAIYLSDALVSNLVKGLANLAGINVATCSLRNKCLPDENHIVLQIVNEAHGILAHKNYLKSVWHENEIAVSYLTAVLSAVILDYTLVRPKARNNGLTSESLTLWRWKAGSCTPRISNQFSVEKELMHDDTDSSLCNAAQASANEMSFKDCDQEEIDEDPRPDCHKSAGTAFRDVTLKAKRGIQASLSKLFFFKSKASPRVGPCPRGRKK
ncbi:uncharacterized protein LOC107692612 [Sinocyclocheilus anshuiensis]|uniref:uncharacterized protein LOC107692612 n=1 Tax=Sinocyclocheilus anshuiensis TaxID=1608454 RepID=UPI0007B85065|nr:PREDICTED: uncharacterized protein LOC107692612 [Sinocyclocheilus anshuiensis]XP_016347245.1 PREDICTED: uncharacterized protein LOC107692612 [Sinocyclocheilus anshuiensis]